MYYEDMHTMQREEEERFVSIFETHGWEARETSAMLHAGVWMYPEGIAFWQSAGRTAVTEYHAEERTVMLIIMSDTEDTVVRLKLFFGEHFADIITTIAAHTALLTFQHVAVLLKAIYPLTHSVFLVVDADHAFPVVLPDDDDHLR